MSLDDTDNSEIELRDLVTQTLEENGILTKVRAQLRAGLYLALENDINTGYQDNNNELKNKLASPDIRIIFCLVREFLEYFELDFTCSVFDKETFFGTAYSYENREKLVEELDIGIDTFQSAPLLLELLKIAKNCFNISVKDFNKNNNSTYDIIPEENLKETDISLSESSEDKSLTKENSKEENKSVNCLSEKENKLNEGKINCAAKNEEKFEEDTFEDTSSIAEDVTNRDQNLIDFDKSIKLSADESPRSSQSKKLDKLEKLKPMSALSSLSDLPPLQLNKSRNSDTVLLPSLYSKEFREKSSLKEIDKLLDIDCLDNYEEDFMSSGSVDNNEDLAVNIFLSTQNNVKLKTDNGKALIENPLSGNIASNESKERSNSASTSVSEDFDDLLKSGSTI